MREKTRRSRVMYLASLGVWVGGLLFLRKLFSYRGVVNRGGVFGLFDGAWWWLLLVGVVLVYLGWVWWQATTRFQFWGLYLVLVGGLANAAERMLYGEVMDYIYYPFLGVYGNMADILLGIGVIVLCLSNRPTKT